MTTTIKAKKRTDTGKGAARKLRADGKLPGIIYGALGEPLSLTLEAKEFLNIIDQEGESGLIDLLVEDEEGKKVVQEKAVIRNVDYHPIKDIPIHVDFLSVAMDKKITVSTPLELIGEAVGVTTSKGILTQIVHELEIECLPGSLPSSIKIDITNLDIGDSVHVSDLDAIEGVKIKTSLDQTIVTIEAPKLEAAEEVTEEEMEEAAPGEGETPSEKARAEEGQE